MKTLTVKIPEGKATTESTVAAYAAVGAAAAMLERLHRHVADLNNAGVIKTGAPLRKQNSAMHNCRAAYQDTVTYALALVDEGDTAALAKVMRYSKCAITEAKAYIGATRAEADDAQRIMNGDTPAGYEVIQAAGGHAIARPVA